MTAQYQVDTIRGGNQVLIIYRIQDRPTQMGNTNNHITFLLLQDGYNTLCLSNRIKVLYPLTVIVSILTV